MEAVVTDESMPPDVVDLARRMLAMDDDELATFQRDHPDEITRLCRSVLRKVPAHLRPQ